ncbi:2-amino-3-ketobutyrate coenzyme A ligase, mitochondrial isoform X1 [Leguminivora glycinivorella]|uniref:2-amino-3-ketobutyrate coenzyme A ligase, mitochondrial isoform X1 n=1 Tax=Leguminivora glycinivorella TaxID=1035111 RepID=UPI00200D38D2|nr:2-amino-3-ketobutyrate coenzyme A ligase, mitochondrial isoform X1 [Leguminivora glycinivorella]
MCDHFSDAESKRDHGDARSKSPKRPQPRRNLIWDNTREFLSNTTLHGFRYLLDAKSSWFERLWWLFMVIASIVVCVVFIRKVWIKWDETPVIVSFADTTNSVWTIPFPAVTICSETKPRQRVFNYTEAYHERRRTPSTISAEDLKTYQDMLLLCNNPESDGPEFADKSSIETLQKLAPTRDDLFLKCLWKNLSCGDMFYHTLTKDGYCFTFNMLSEKKMFRTENLHKDYYHVAIKNDSEWSLDKGYPLDTNINTYPLRGPSYGGVEFEVVLTTDTRDMDLVCRGPVQGFKVWLHNPAELPNMGQNFFRLPIQYQSAASITPKMMDTSEGLKGYAPNKRGCYFPEDRYLRFFRIYTQRNCELECSSNFTAKMCGCVPLYMPLYAGKQATRQLHELNGKERAGVTKLREVLDDRLQEIKKAKTWKHERILTSPQDTKIRVQGAEGEFLNFCANNYLGLSNHPEVVEAAREGLRKYGAGLSSVRFICGTQTLHKELEHRLSQFHGREDTILYGSCFDANAGLFESMLTPEDAVFSDALNHASIIDGIRLCKAQKYRYPHRDLSELEHLLAHSEARIKLIVTDGVFSMDGNVAPLPGLRNLADKYRALLAVDDSHATGFLGATGRGTEEYCNIMGAADIICSTLGKAVSGAAGGYTTGPKELITLLRNVSRPYLFSNAPPPPVVAASLKSLDLVEGSSELRERLQQNTRSFREGLKAAGLTVAGDDHPICPVMVGEAPLAVELASGMLQRGIYVVAFSYPVVPKGGARVRVQLSAAHTPEDVNRAVHAFTEVGKNIGLIKG